MSKQTYLPATLALIPLPKPVVLFPFLQVSITLGTEAVSHILSGLSEQSESAKQDSRERYVAAVPVAEGDRRVGRWATAARVKRIYRAHKDDDVWTVVLEGLSRIHLPRSLPPILSVLPPLPLPVSTYSLPVPSPARPTINLLPAATKLLSPELHPKLAALPPSIQTDLLASSLRFDWDVRVELLSTPDVDDRCARVREVMLALLSAKGIGPPDDSALATPPGQSQALVRRRPQKDSPSKMQLPDDLKPLEATLQKRGSEMSPEAAQAVQRELQRLSKIPSQAAEYGVAKTYCEWLLALPWGRVSEGKRVDLEAARKMLDDEHEGLAEVKRRVIEYLAVYRLRRDLWEEKRKADADAEAAEVSKNVDEGVALDDKADDVATSAPSPTDANRQSAPTNPKSADANAPPDNVFRDKAPILLLVGPPGVGKTSIARSIANALGRKFHRISLGGVRDEAEIRGHRRTYVGALPGLFVQGLRKVTVSNPIILLDELDKVGTSNYHGDPAAALLETLDPAQNWAFHDHYLGDVPIDLSQVTFVATANSLDTISPPLLDRCEVIECPGYVTDEKLAIARRFLLPKQTIENGLGNSGVITSDQVLTRVVNEYTREAGVRSLEREIAKLCRAKAVEFSTSRDGGAAYNPEIVADDLERILGMAKYEQELREQDIRPGVVTGLAYRGSGNGGILLIESTLIPGGKGRLQLTGSLGDVIRESAELALAWVKSHGPALGLGTDPLRGVDIHLHFPAGAVKKDGPSAGTAILLTFVSLLTNRPVPPTIALTGEITLRGAVTAVGGIREKLLGAHRAGITRCILPAQNEKDTHDLPASARSMNLTFVRTAEQLLEEVWGRDTFEELRRTDLARL
ncbi:hypothetical protein Q8F55_000346 [Vanrija albida]|uniref:Lon protease homolog n=1 Tax=Vanrija albida TaxID=181172 RepID=A0ABR3QD01_9TREE